MVIPKGGFVVLRYRVSLGLLIVLAVFTVPNCKAQHSNSVTASSDGTTQALDSKVTRSIELTLRAKLQIPPEYVIHVGPRKPSSTPGFDALTVNFDLPGHPEHS